MLSKFIKAIYIAQYSIDFRKGLSGLLAEAYSMELDPYNGDCVVFFHKSWRQIKFICGDEYGLCIATRYFDGGAIKHKIDLLESPCFMNITHAELLMMLEGANFEVKSRPKIFRKKVA